MGCRLKKLTVMRETMQIIDNQRVCRIQDRLLPGPGPPVGIMTQLIIHRRKSCPGITNEKAVRGVEAFSMRWNMIKTMIRQALVGLGHSQESFSDINQQTLEKFPTRQHTLPFHRDSYVSCY
eukprot:754407-Hanusia_phi.AAC.1